MTNTSLRLRFGISKNSRSQVSRYIKESLELKDIKLKNKNASPKMKRYIPIWA